jgi:hypothetical protein
VNSGIALLADFIEELADRLECNRLCNTNAPPCDSSYNLLIA